MSWRSYRGGVWIWGVALAVWLALLVLALGWGVFEDLRCREHESGANLYCVVNNNETAVAAVTAVLGVIWSWFLQMQQKQQEIGQKREALRQQQQDLDLRRAKLERKNGKKGKPE